MNLSKGFILFLFISLINLAFISCVIEIPLESVEVEGIFKYKNITRVPAAKPSKKKGNLRFIETGYSEICQNMIFLAPIKIGSNSQVFKLLLDTGSSVLWVAKPGVAGTNAITRFYDPSKSTTSKASGQNFEIKYGSGYCHGYYYDDNAEYLANKKFNIIFGLSDHADYNVHDSDGIVGLSRNYQDARLSFIQMMKQYGNTDSLAFSVKFDSIKFAPNVVGSMFIGIHDDFKKSETVSTPLNTFYNNYFWSSSLDSFGLKNQNTHSKSNVQTNVIFDTGTNAILLPIRYLVDLQSTLRNYGCFVMQNGNNYQIACQPNGPVPDMTFKFNGNTLVIPKNYAYYYDSKYHYVISLVTFVNSKVYIMGSPFFFVFHTLCDPDGGKLKFYPIKGSIIRGN